MASCKLPAAASHNIDGVRLKRRRPAACVRPPVVVEIGCAGGQGGAGGSPGRAIQLSLHELPNLVKLNECQLVLPDRRLSRSAPLFCLFTVQPSLAARDRIQGEGVEAEKDALLELFLWVARLFEGLLLAKKPAPCGRGTAGAQASRDGAVASRPTPCVGASVSAEAIEIAPAPGGEARAPEDGRLDSGVAGAEDPHLWVEILDPASGMPLHGRHGCASWNELDAGSLFLGYRPSKSGCCAQLSHPVWGSAVYPASIFASGPRELVLEALDELENELRRTLGPKAGEGSSDNRP